MSKYIDLLEAIAESEEIGSSVHYGVKLALKYLDKHPDQAPSDTATTMTVSEWTDEVAHMDNRPDRVLGFIKRFVDFEVIPDPEPTNTDRLEQLIRESGFEVSTSGFATDARELAERLNSDGVKAPGDADE